MLPLGLTRPAQCACFWLLILALANAQCEYASENGAKGITREGVSFPVLCSIQKDGGWVSILKRYNGEVDF